MTRVLDFRPRNAKVRAMRIILGVTTRTQILEFCPSANVGCGAEGGVADEKDIRWVSINNGPGIPANMDEDGDWLVLHSSGRYEFLSDTEFHAEYEPDE